MCHRKKKKNIFKATGDILYTNLKIHIIYAYLDFFLFYVGEFFLVSVYIDNMCTWRMQRQERDVGSPGPELHVFARHHLSEC